MKNYRIHYLRRGENTVATKKNGEVLTFETINKASNYVNKVRITDSNDPLTFMNKVSICEYNGDEFVEVIEQI